MGGIGIIEGAEPGTVVIDMSSIAPLVSTAICTELETIGVEMLVAPVSGREPKVIDGTISVMVGGRKEVFVRRYDLMMTMAGSVVYPGQHRSRQHDT